MYNFIYLSTKWKNVGYRVVEFIFCVLTIVDKNNHHHIVNNINFAKCLF